MPPLLSCPRGPWGPEEAQTDHGVCGRAAVLQGWETLTQLPGPHPSQNASQGLGDKVRPR